MRQREKKGLTGSLHFSHYHAEPIKEIKGFKVSSSSSVSVPSSSSFLLVLYCWINKM